MSKAMNLFKEAGIEDPISNILQAAGVNAGVAEVIAEMTSGGHGGSRAAGISVSGSTNVADILYSVPAYVTSGASMSMHSAVGNLTVAVVQQFGASASPAGTSVPITYTSGQTTLQEVGAAYRQQALTQGAVSDSGTAAAPAEAGAYYAQQIAAHLGYSQTTAAAVVATIQEAIHSRTGDINVEILSNTLRRDRGDIDSAIAALDTAIGAGYLNVTVAMAQEALKLPGNTTSFDTLLETHRIAVSPGLVDSDMEMGPFARVTGLSLKSMIGKVMSAVSIEQLGSIVDDKVIERETALNQVLAQQLPADTLTEGSGAGISATVTAILQTAGGSAGIRPTAESLIAPAVDAVVAQLNLPENVAAQPAVMQAVRNLVSAHIAQQRFFAYEASAPTAQTDQAATDGLTDVFSLAGVTVGELKTLVGDAAFNSSFNAKVVPLVQLSSDVLARSDINSIIGQYLKQGAVLSITNVNGVVDLDFAGATKISVDSSKLAEQGLVTIRANTGNNLRTSEHTLRRGADGKFSLEKTDITVDRYRFAVEKNGEGTWVVQAKDAGDVQAKEAADTINEIARKLEEVYGITMGVRNDVRQFEKALDIAFGKDMLWEIPAGTGKSYLLFTFAAAIAKEVNKQKMIFVLHNEPLYDDAVTEKKRKVFFSELEQVLGSDVVTAKFETADLRALEYGAAAGTSLRGVKLAMREVAAAESIGVQEGDLDKIAEQVNIALNQDGFLVSVKTVAEKMQAVAGAVLSQEDQGKLTSAVAEKMAAAVIEVHTSQVQAGNVLNKLAESDVVYIESDTLGFFALAAQQAGAGIRDGNNVLQAWESTFTGSKILADEVDTMFTKNRFQQGMGQHALSPNEVNAARLVGATIRGMDVANPYLQGLAKKVAVQILKDESKVDSALVSAIADHLAVTRNPQATGVQRSEAENKVLENRPFTSDDLQKAITSVDDFMQTLPDRTLLSDVAEGIAHSLNVAELAPSRWATAVSTIEEGLAKYVKAMPAPAQALAPSEDADALAIPAVGDLALTGSDTSEGTTKAVTKMVSALQGMGIDLGAGAAADLSARIEKHLNSATIGFSELSAAQRLQSERGMLVMTVRDRTDNTYSQMRYADYISKTDLYKYDIVGVAYDTTAKQAIVKALNAEFGDEQALVEVTAQGDIEMTEAGQKNMTQAQKERLMEVKASVSGRVKALRQKEGRDVGYDENWKIEGRNAPLIRPFANKVVAPELQQADAYLAAHSELVFKDYYQDALLAKGDAEGARALLHKVEVSGKSRVTPIGRAITMAKAYGADFSGFSGTLSHFTSFGMAAYGVTVAVHTEVLQSAKNLAAELGVAPTNYVKFVEIVEDGIRTALTQDAPKAVNTIRNKVAQLQVNKLISDEQVAGLNKGLAAVLARQAKPESRLVRAEKNKEVADQTFPISYKWDFSSGQEVLHSAEFKEMITNGKPVQVILDGQGMTDELIFLEQVKNTLPIGNTIIVKDQGTGWDQFRKAEDGTLTYLGKKNTEFVKTYLENRKSDEKVMIYYTLSATRGVDVESVSNDLKMITENRVNVEDPFESSQVQVHAFYDPLTTDVDAEQLLKRDRGMMVMVNQFIADEAFNKMSGNVAQDLVEKGWAKYDSKDGLNGIRLNVNDNLNFSNAKAEMEEFFGKEKFDKEILPVLQASRKATFIYLNKTNGEYEATMNPGIEHEAVYNPLTVYFIQPQGAGKVTTAASMVDTFKKNTAKMESEAIYNLLAEVYDTVPVRTLEGIRDRAQARGETQDVAIVNELIVEFQSQQGKDYNVMLQTTAENGVDALQNKLDSIYDFFDRQLKNNELLNTVSGQTRADLEILTQQKPRLEFGRAADLQPIVDAAAAVAKAFNIEVGNNADLRAGLVTYLRAAPAQKEANLRKLAKTVGIQDQLFDAFRQTVDAQMQNIKPIAFSESLAEAATATVLLVPESALPAIAPFSGPSSSLVRVQTVADVKKNEKLTDADIEAIKPVLKERGFYDETTQLVTPTGMRLIQGAQAVRQNLTESLRDGLVKLDVNDRLNSGMNKQDAAMLKALMLLFMDLLGGEDDNAAVLSLNGSSPATIERLATVAEGIVKLSAAIPGVANLLTEDGRTALHEIMFSDDSLSFVRAVINKIPEGTEGPAAEIKSQLSAVADRVGAVRQKVEKLQEKVAYFERAIANAEADALAKKSATQAAAAPEDKEKEILTPSRLVRGAWKIQYANNQSALEQAQKDLVTVQPTLGELNSVTALLQSSEESAPQGVDISSAVLALFSQDISLEKRQTAGAVLKALNNVVSQAKHDTKATVQNLMESITLANIMDFKTLPSSADPKKSGVREQILGRIPVVKNIINGSDSKVPVTSEQILGALGLDPTVTLIGALLPALGGLGDDGFEGQLVAQLKTIPVEGYMDKAALLKWVSGYDMPLVKLSAMALDEEKYSEAESILTVLEQKPGLSAHDTIEITLQRAQILVKSGSAQPVASEQTLQTEAGKLYQHIINNDEATPVQKARAYLLKADINAKVMDRENGLKDAILAIDKAIELLLPENDSALLRSAYEKKAAVIGEQLQYLSDDERVPAVIEIVKAYESALALVPAAEQYAVGALRNHGSAGLCAAAVASATGDKDYVVKAQNHFAVVAEHASRDSAEGFLSSRLQGKEITPEIAAPAQRILQVRNQAEGFVAAVSTDQDTSGIVNAVSIVLAQSATKEEPGHLVSVFKNEAQSALYQTIHKMRKGSDGNGDATKIDEVEQKLTQAVNEVVGSLHRIVDVTQAAHEFIADTDKIDQVKKKVIAALDEIEAQYRPALRAVFTSQAKIAIAQQMQALRQGSNGNGAAATIPEKEKYLTAQLDAVDEALTDLIERKESVRQSATEFVNLIESGAKVDKINDVKIAVINIIENAEFLDRSMLCETFKNEAMSAIDQKIQEMQAKSNDNGDAAMIDAMKTKLTQAVKEVLQNGLGYSWIENLVGVGGDMLGLMREQPAPAVVQAIDNEIKFEFVEAVAPRVGGAMGRFLDAEGNPLAVTVERVNGSKLSVRGQNGELETLKLFNGTSRDQALKPVDTSSLTGQDKENADMILATTSVNLILFDDSNAPVIRAYGMQEDGGVTVFVGERLWNENHDKQGIVLFHETAEAMGDKLALPTVTIQGKEVTVSVHTYLRGAGKDVRAAVKALVESGAMPATAEAKDVIKAINAQMEEMSTGAAPEIKRSQMSDSEAALITYNMTQSGQGNTPDATIVFGLQDKLFGETANTKLTGLLAANSTQEKVAVNEQNPPPATKTDTDAMKADVINELEAGFPASKISVNDMKIMKEAFFNSPAVRSF
ncbi:MAG: hypothetical protein NC924_06385 [Candidatus Omnitrophica bacterium]|nr:hypothetical protein [Candidatus Omnitrophota bacterium]